MSRFLSITLGLLICVGPAHAATASFAQIFKAADDADGDGGATSYALNTNSILLQASPVAGADFRFVSRDPAATVFAGGNNEGGTLRFRDGGGVARSITGVVSRKNTGSTQIAFYFVEADVAGTPLAAARACLFVVPTQEANVTAGVSFSTSSAGVTSGLNALLGLQPTLSATGIDDGDADNAVNVGDTLSY